MKNDLLDKFAERVFAHIDMPRQELNPLLALLSERTYNSLLENSLIALAAVVFGVIVYTAQVNLPLNYYTESWDPQNVPADWMDIRTQWNSANAFRGGTSALAFALSVFALVVRASGTKMA